ncbi:unnamed protein product, partial [Polarella glacialis]
DVYEPQMEMDGMLSSSWPGSSAPPPRPSRKPSDADWEVPPLMLSKKSRSCSFTSTSASGDVQNEMEDAERNEDEVCMFGFDSELLEGAADSDAEEEFSAKLQLVDLNDREFPAGMTKVTFDSSAEMASPASSARYGRPRRSSSCSMSPSLGASPVLLSALERVAAEAGTHLKTRHRVGTC